MAVSNIGDKVMTVEQGIDWKEPIPHDFCRTCGVITEKSFLIFKNSIPYCMRCIKDKIIDWCPGCDTCCH